VEVWRGVVTGGTQHALAHETQAGQMATNKTRIPNLHTDSAEVCGMSNRQRQDVQKGKER
jgi:hypothetical protein